MLPSASLIRASSLPNHLLSTKYGSYAPFTLVLGGQTVHVVGNPPDVKAVYRLSKALSFEPITVDFVALFGMTTSKRLRDAFPVEGVAGLHHSASGEANLIQLAHPFFRDELTSRQRLEIISERYMTALEAVMNGVQDRFARDATRKGDLEKHRQLSIEVPMWRFCREAVFTASVNGMYGPSLLRKHSETFDVYNAFDEEFYKLVMQVSAPRCSINVRTDSSPSSSPPAPPRMCANTVKSC